MLPRPSTISELLQNASNGPRSGTSITFMNNDGSVAGVLSYKDLYNESIAYASQLRAAGLKPSDIVLSSFTDHESHIRLFWACCFAGVIFCPLPAPHPDPTRQALLLNHLRTLFHDPLFIGSAEMTENAQRIVSGLRTMTPAQFQSPENLNIRSVFPEVCPSPNDSVCFMLTSGSTGNSKAVILKHSNILSAIRGKALHHGSSSSSKFLNWIAFDHVACVTEIHLQALQVTASQWHIAPAAIMRNPLLFLELTGRLEITYTFSPNFLLAQILLAPELHTLKVDLSHLKALISGGEAVPLETAMTLADLLERHGAPRDCLRAGFGMSETCAGSIYDQRPIPRERISGLPCLSLGQCCPGIQMRVADGTTGDVLPPDHSGSLQISGPTVFSGYYGNIQATEDSFTPDGWFITGDLARIDKEGNLHLVGREKDYVNINGVKYLPQDAVRYIEDSRVPGVSYPLVFITPLRLDGASTETYAVFYQHSDVDISEQDDWVPTPAETAAFASTNKTIKQLCMIFFSSPPHVVLPLPSKSFVRTALGKVSQAQLLKSYLQGRYNYLSSVVDSVENTDNGAADVTPVGKIVCQAARDIFNIDPLHSLLRSQNIYDLGASSMHLVRLKQTLQDQLSLPDIPTIELLKRPFIGELIDFLESRSATTATPPIYQPLICLSNSGLKPPLFLIHPGVGEVLVFINLSRLITDRPVYALRARGFDNDERPFDSFSEIVECYISAIEEAYPTGSIYIAGYSFGGAVAFEVAKVFEVKGRVVSWVGILNLPPHIQSRMNELDLREVLLNLGVFLSLVDEAYMDNLRPLFPAVTDGDGADSVIEASVHILFSRSDQKRIAELDLSIPPLIRWVKVAYAINLTGRSYVPSGSVKNALTTVFCAIPLPSMGTREEYKAQRLSLWKEFSGERFEMVDVDGEHYTMLGETHVASFARLLAAALDRAG